MVAVPLQPTQFPMALAAHHTRRAASGATSCSYATDVAPSLPTFRQLTSGLPNPRIGQASVSGRAPVAALPGQSPSGLRQLGGPIQQRNGRLQRLAPHASSGGKAADDEDEAKQGWKFGRNEGPMTWPWKLMCCILYMLPWVDVTEKTVYFIERFPAFVWTEFFTEPFEHWFYIHEYAPLIIFFATYLGIVRNKRIPHVARYHIMMGVMLDIVAMILIVVEENLPFGVLWTPWSDLFYALMFWLVFLVLVYCLFFCFMGWYCEIPLVSEGVYMQIEQAEQMGAGGR